MRILSQDLSKDVPYEQVAIILDGRDERKILAIGTNAEGEFSYFPMAQYSSIEKSKKAMEMLRNAYSPKIEIKEPKKAEIPEPRAGDRVWTVTEPKIEVLDNFYFQFPADSEIEV